MKHVCYSILIYLVIASLAVAAESSRPARAIPEGATPRDRFLKLIDRPRVPLDAVETAFPSEIIGLQEFRFEFTSEPGQRVPGLLAKPANSKGKLPAAFVLHGSGANKERMRGSLQRFALRGFVAVAIDGRYHGERAPNGKGTDEHRTAVQATWQSGEHFPIIYDSVWDVMRLVDYLQSRPDVDPQRIGGNGFSRGGGELWLAAAADTRIAAAVPCLAVQSFSWGLNRDGGRSRIGQFRSTVESAATESGSEVDTAFVKRFYDRVAPGIYQEFDCSVMLPLIAPRPLLVINGDRDERTPQASTDLCIIPTKAAYNRAGASENFEFLLQRNTGHSLTPETQDYAIQWMSEVLKAEK